MSIALAQAVEQPAAGVRIMNVADVREAKL
jgi:hypothetical protein